jgi:NADPH:quinone reductase-like Zn-dependent oxidoreductase
MKQQAIVQRSYGSADVLEFREVDMPTVGDSDVLIRVHAASLHIGDWHLMTGLPYMLRVVGFGLRAPKTPVRGIDVAGTIEAVGRNVTEFRAGDEVFGTCEGAFAEYARAPEISVALKPRNLTFQQAAAVPTSAFAALQALRDVGEIRSEQKVLIIGATGGVGIFAVQIAKSLGAIVTGVCSTEKIDLVHSLGADHVIDYVNGDFTKGTQRYDLILDTGGNRSLAELRRVLAPSGILVLVGGEGGNRIVGTTGKWLQAALLSPFSRQKLRPLVSKPSKADLLVVKGMVEAGQVTPVIDRAFALREVPEAFRYLRGGRGRGKIVITP